MNKKFTYYTMLGFLALMTITMGYNTYLQLYPFKTVDIKSVELLTPTIPIGGSIKYRLSYCRYTDAETTVYRTVVEADNVAGRYPMPATAGTSVIGCHVIERSISIDPSIPPGEYYIDVAAFYKVNSQQSRKVDFKIGNFIIK